MSTKIPWRNYKYFSPQTIEMKIDDDLVAHIKYLAYQNNFPEDKETLELLLRMYKDYEQVVKVYETTFPEKPLKEKIF